MFCGVRFFIKHSIFRKGTLPFASSISILLVSSFKDGRSLGEGRANAGVAAILMKRLNTLLKKSHGNRKKERRMEPPF